MPLCVYHSIRIGIGPARSVQAIRRTARPVWIQFPDHLASVSSTERLAPRSSDIRYSLLDPISVFINVSLVVSVIVALPFIFYELYGFVAPGLYSREKKAVRKYLLPFTVLFVTGALFGLFVIFPIIMRILIIFMRAFVGCR